MASRLGPWWGWWGRFGRARRLVALLRDPHAPLAPRVVALGALLYAVMPVDVVADFLPLAGWVDDALLLALAWRYLGRYERKRSGGNGAGGRGDSRGAP